MLPLLSKAATDGLSSLAAAPSSSRKVSTVSTHSSCAPFLTRSPIVYRQAEVACGVVAGCSITPRPQVPVRSQSSTPRPYLHRTGTPALPQESPSSPSFPQPSFHSPMASPSETVARRHRDGGPLWGRRGVCSTGPQSAPTFSWRAVLDLSLTSDQTEHEHHTPFPQSFVSGRAAHSCGLLAATRARRTAQSVHQ